MDTSLGHAFSHARWLEQLPNPQLSISMSMASSRRVASGLPWGSSANWDTFGTDKLHGRSIKELWVSTSLAAMVSSGKPIGPLDLLIAAHALSQNLIIVTNNDKEFKRIKNLEAENWTKYLSSRNYIL
jgi:hypothetical protein